MLRRQALGLIVGLSAAVVAREGEARKPEAIPRVGVLVSTRASEDLRMAFGQGLREQGYVDGLNVLIEWRAANLRPERASAAAADFVRSNVDVIVASLSLAVKAAQKATRTIPIVMAPAGDPIKQGFAASLARPGGNITGLTSVELSAKRLELLRELIPALKRVGLLLNSSDPSYAMVVRSGTEHAARELGIDVFVAYVQGPEGLNAAFAALTKAGCQAINIQPSLLLPKERAAIVAGLAMRHKLPSISNPPVFPASGGLMSYGASFRDEYRQAAVYVAKILRGANPANLPIEQASIVELVINLDTAKALGLTVPPSLLLQAEQLIGRAQ